MKVKKFVQERKLTSAAILMGFTILMLAWIFASEIKSKQEFLINTKLGNSNLVIERSVGDLVKQTGFIMKMMNDKISKDPENKKYINEVINSFQIDPTVANTIPWTYFDWADKDSYITVNSVNGILDEPVDISERNYLRLSREHPDMLHLSEPLMGKTSKRWIVVAAMGAKDKNNNYIGANVLGFDLNTMAVQLRAMQQDPNISFYLFDKRGNLLIDSSKEVQGNLNEAPEDATDTLKKYMENNNKNTESEINIIGDKESYSITRIDNLPFYVYIKYNSAAIKSEFWQSVISRLLEMSVIGLVGIGITVFVYRRERALRRKAEDSFQMALSASKGKSEFLAYTGHELRSPLNVIIFGSEMMKSEVFGDLPPKYKEYAEDIFQNGNDLLDFIEDLMDITKADEEGKFSLNPEYVDLNEAVDRVIKLNITRATKHKVRLEKLIAPDLPKLWADPRRLRQILNNLISNAIKYSPENTSVRVFAHSIDGILQIVVEDQGFGMNAEQVQIAMSRYGTVQNENTGKVDSIGLGLPLVKQLMDAHKGRFKIESEPNKGTSVTLTFKVAEQRLAAC